MARITEAELFEIVEVFTVASKDTLYADISASGLVDADRRVDELLPRVVELVAELRRLRSILDRVFEHVGVADAELEHEVLEIRQERRSAAVSDRLKEQA